MPVPTITASLSPGTISSGGISVLSWTTTNATSVVIDNGVGEQPANGSINVSGSSAQQVQAMVNAPYPNRIQLAFGSSPTVFHLTAIGPGGTASTTAILNVGLFGPFSQLGPLASFDPRRDVEVYVDGVRQTVQTFSFDPIFNRYLLFLSTTFNLRGVIQLVHHVPNPFFTGKEPPIAQAFKITGTFSGSGTFYAPIPSDVIFGNQLLLGLEISDNTAQPSLSDSLGLPWNLVSYLVGGGPPPDNRNFTVWQTPVIHSGSDILAISTFGTIEWSIIGVELQGVGDLITTSPVNNTGTSASWASEPITVNQDSILVALDVGYSPPVAIADDFQLLDTQLVGSPPVELTVATKIVTLGTYTSSWTQAASDEWQTVLTGFNIQKSVLPGFAIFAQFSPNGDPIGWGTSWGRAWGQA